jgi:hypothetical protein
MALVGKIRQAILKLGSFFLKVFDLTPLWAPPENGTSNLKVGNENVYFVFINAVL